jgi:hypothetical protein
MWWRIPLLVIAGLAVCLTAVFAVGAVCWRAGTKTIRSRLEAVRLPVRPQRFVPDELEGLPAPVRRYFDAALGDGQPMIVAVSMEHTGTFDMSDSGGQWKPFTSIQRVVMKRPGFDWNARIKAAPGLTVRVHDAYLDGEGLLHASLFGLIPLVRMRGTGEEARSELMRFFAEAPWYPTALLPSQGVHWEAVDDASARSTFTEGETTVSMLFRFDQNNMIESVRAQARGRAVGDEMIPTPWEGRWREYEIREGMRIPLEGEVAWMLPGGPKPYWRERVTGVTYEWAE